MAQVPGQGIAILAGSSVRIRDLLLPSASQLGQHIHAILQSGGRKIMRVRGRAVLLCVFRVWPSTCAGLAD